jgi:hypothetical protein
MRALHITKIGTGHTTVGVTKQADFCEQNCYKHYKPSDSYIILKIQYFNSKST